ncbi:preprotein translocase subunit YajC [Elstera litoralis]|uniref:Sec translocon accessory complex subunit YajC n=1 Tax=Elstera litoralis TaxID=552518 RepID=A0A0F3IRZ4_9PROT|nr:preprotein translocase subunit YajC [Elstera litoralis]KJV09318.1 preprotein translocase subunit YajC [Elstera litoralis]
MFISPAFAQDAAAASGGINAMLVQFGPLILIFIVFYFLLIRPQQKKAKAHREMLSNVRRGDRIVTSGGIIGTVTKADGDAELQIEIAEGVRIRVLRGAVSDVLAKTDPAKADKADAKEETKA